LENFLGVFNTGDKPKYNEAEHNTEMAYHRLVPWFCRR